MCGRSACTPDSSAANIGFGMAAVRLETRGDAIGSLPSRTSAAWDFGPYLHAGPALGSSSLRVRLDLGILLTLRYARIRFALMTSLCANTLRRCFVLRLVRFVR